MKRLSKSVPIIVIVLLVVSFLSGCGKKQDTIKIATKPMTEQFILSEMLSILIEENTDLKVEITKGIGGGTGNIHPALIKGDFHMYPEYTGTAWSYVLKKEEIPDSDILYKELQKEYEEKYDLKWVGAYGFNNTFGLGISKEVADKYSIKTYSDLAKYSSELNFGAEYDFYEREDGFDALCSTYGLKFKEHLDLDIGLKYEAIKSKKVDVINIFTTDGQLSVSDMIVLQDDKNFFPSYYCGTVVRKDILQKHSELEEMLMTMDGIISESEMAKLNYEVEGNGKDERTVAREFLISKGLIKK